MEFIAMSFSVKVVPDMFDVSLRHHLEQGHQAYRQFLLIEFLFLYQIDHDHPLVIIDNILDMALEDMACQFFTSLHTYNIIQALLFLFPEKRNGPPNLNETVQMLLIGDN
jgi:hypothetical protein